MERKVIERIYEIKYKNKNTGQTMVKSIDGKFSFLRNSTMGLLILSKQDLLDQFNILEEVVKHFKLIEK